MNTSTEIKIACKNSSPGKTLGFSKISFLMKNSIMTLFTQNVTIVKITKFKNLKINKFLLTVSCKTNLC